MPTLPKTKILRSRKSFERLFAEGERERHHPILVRFVRLQPNFTSKFAFVAPKRNLKKAVQRNRVKRQMREAFRLNQCPELEYGFEVLFIFTARSEVAYAEIEKGIQKCQEKLMGEKV